MKWLKRLSIGFSIVVFIVCVALLVLTLKLNPNAFKPWIENEISAETGLNLHINGDVTWKFFPYFGLEAHDLNMSPERKSEAQFLMHIKAVALRIRLFSLLILGVKAGAANTQVKNISSVITAVHIKDGDIIWPGIPDQNSFKVIHLNVDMKNINIHKSFKLQGSFSIQIGNLDARTQIKLQSNVFLHPDAQRFTFEKLTLRGDTELNHTKHTWQFEGDVFLDLAHTTFTTQEFSGSIDNIIQLKGNIFGYQKESNQLYGRGDFALKPVDLAAWLKRSGFNLPGLQQWELMGGDFTFSSLDPIKIKFNTQRLKIANVLLTDLTIPIVFTPGQVSATIDSNAYGGKAYVQISLIYHAMQPLLNLSLAANNINTQALSADLVSAFHPKLTLTGTGNVSLQLHATLNSTYDAVNRVTGKGEFKINHGTLQGMDIPNLMETAYRFINSGNFIFRDSGSTPFDTFHGKFILDNSLINSEISLLSPLFTTSGQGTINYRNETVEYYLQTKPTLAFVTTHPSKIDISHVSIPIIIKGPWKNPAIGLDVDSLAKYLAGLQLEKVKRDLEDKIKVPKKAKNFLNRILGS